MNVKPQIVCIAFETLSHDADEYVHEQILHVCDQYGRVFYFQKGAWTQVDLPELPPPPLAAAE